MGTTLKTLTKTVSSAGTAEALSSSTLLASSFIIRAMEDNTGAVYVGDSTVDNTSGKLEPRASISFGGNANIGLADLASIYVDAGNNDDGVDVWYMDESP